MNYIRGSKEKFNYDILRGKAGEIVSQKVLLANPSVKKITDVSNDISYQKEDVDFIVELLNGNNIKIEIKTDYLAWKTGNIVYEMKTSGNIGCFEKTTAERIMYCLTDEHKKITKILSLSTSKLRNLVHGVHSFRYCRMGDFAEGWVIPIKALYDNNIVTSEYLESDIYA